MRRSFDGLCATVIEVLELNPLEGHLFLFRGKRADRDSCGQDLRRRPHRRSAPRATRRSRARA
jgi:hypothetical protein